MARAFIWITNFSMNNVSYVFPGQSPKSQFLNANFYLNTWSKIAFSFLKQKKDPIFFLIMVIILYIFTISYSVSFRPLCTFGEVMSWGNLVKINSLRHSYIIRILHVFKSAPNSSKTSVRVVIMLNVIHILLLLRNQSKTVCTL